MNDIKNHPTWNRRNKNKHYKTARYLAGRKITMARDNWICQPCLKEGRVTPATTCDHIYPVFDGRGNERTHTLEGLHIDDPLNMQAACVKCNREKITTDLGHTLRPKYAVDINGDIIDPEHPWNKGSTTEPSRPTPVPKPPPPPKKFSAPTTCCDCGHRLSEDVIAEAARVFPTGGGKELKVRCEICMRSIPKPHTIA